MHYIFEVTVKPGYTVEQYAEAWVEASRIIQRAKDVWTRVREPEVTSRALETREVTIEQVPPLLRSPSHRLQQFEGHGR